MTRIIQRILMATLLVWSSAYGAAASTTEAAMVKDATKTSATISQPSESSVTTEDSPMYDGSLANFPTRKVTIAVPTEHRRNTMDFSTHLTRAIANVLKYPYYDTTITRIPEIDTKINTDEMARIAAEENSDIVVIPIALQDTYRQIPHLHPFGLFGDDYNSDIYIEARTSALIHYYDTKDRTVHTIRSGFSQIDDSLTVPSHQSVWNTVTTRLLNKLPYKRVPTDIDRYTQPSDTNITTKAPEELQVKQPKNTKYSLKGVSVL